MFDQKVFDFFRRTFCRSIVFGSPIPIPNFPKNPKIRLKALSDDSKETKKQLEGETAPSGGSGRQFISQRESASIALVGSPLLKDIKGLGAQSNGVSLLTLEKSIGNYPR